ncbi:cytochrome c3 family protein [Thermodesulfobacteriota bacterium]
MIGRVTGYINVFSRSNYRRAMVILPVLALAYLNLPVQASDFQACNKCHERILLEDFSRYSLHSPFANQKCKECHEAEERVVPTAKRKPFVAKKRQQKVKWLGNSTIADTNHGFVLPGDKVGDTLIVEARGTDGAVSRQKIKMPFLADLPGLQDSGRSPAISDVRVLKVDRGVFLKVVIGWQTDTLADALVHYGEKDLSEKSESRKRLGRKHEVILTKLQPDKTYQFVAVSQDLFGRIQTSEPLTFSTSKPMAAVQSKLIIKVNPQRGKEETQIASSFKKLGSDYMLELSLERPAALYVGSTGATRKQELSGQKASTASTAALAKNEESHVGLSSEITVSMSACGSCHKYNSRATHPINVLPKPGMTIPSEYPTLPNGRISCNSCHSLHSSDFEFLTRKRGKRELCVGCHKDMM